MKFVGQRSVFAILLAVAVLAAAPVDFACAQALSPEEAFGPHASLPHTRPHRKLKKRVPRAYAKLNPPPPAEVVAEAPSELRPETKPEALAPNLRGTVAPTFNKPVALLGANGMTFQVRFAAALDLALRGDAKMALEALHNLLAEKEASANELDRVHLSIGRILYGAGDPQGALEQYRQIGRASNSWFEALEERAWCYMRMDRPDEALAQLKTLLLPIFKDQVASEPYYLTAVAHLRVCDYKRVFSTIGEFKKRFRSRIQQWESAGADAAAQAELKATSAIIQKLSLVEAESIQRLYMTDEIKGHKGPENKIQTTRNDLSFPTSHSDEVWMDEVDHYKVSVKGCPRAGTTATGVAGSPSANLSNSGSESL